MLGTKGRTEGGRKGEDEGEEGVPQALLALTGRMMLNGCKLIQDAVPLFQEAVHHPRNLALPPALPPVLLLQNPNEGRGGAREGDLSLMEEPGHFGQSIRRRFPKRRRGERKGEGGRGGADGGRVVGRGEGTVLQGIQEEKERRLHPIELLAGDTLGGGREQGREGGREGGRERRHAYYRPSISVQGPLTFPAVFTTSFPPSFPPTFCATRPRLWARAMACDACFLTLASVSAKTVKPKEAVSEVEEEEGEEDALEGAVQWCITRADAAEKRVLAVRREGRREGREGTGPG